MATAVHHAVTVPSNFGNTNQCFDPDTDSLFDFSQLPSPTPPTIPSHPSNAQPAITSPTNTVLDPDDMQTPAKPSHEYERFKQQTGLPTGSIAGINPSYTTGYSMYSSAAIDEMTLAGEPSMMGGWNSGLPMDMDLSMPSQPAFFYPSNGASQSADFVDPSTITQEQVQNVRVWPGMHQQQAQQQAMAKAQAQAQQQRAQQLMQQRQQQAGQQQTRQQHMRNTSSSPLSDARTEETIARVVNQIRQQSQNNALAGANGQNDLLPHIIRAKKDEDDMDEDERLLASEAGKKLSSKERRQLRNKVSARAFRSRRKEYIGQLEGEIGAKTNECNDLRTQNRALMEENARSRAFIERLLRHQAFTPFLEELSRDENLEAKPAMQTLSASTTPTPAPVRQNQQFAAMSRPQVGMTLVPETPLDMSMLNLNSNAWAMNSGSSSFNYQQPQVFAVTDLPAGPTNPLDMDVISGKGYSSLFAAEDDASHDQVKSDYPVVERAMPSEKPSPVEAEEDQDPEFDLYNAAPVSTPTVPAPTMEEHEALFGDVDSEKAFAHFQLQISDEVADELKMVRFRRQCARMEAVFERVVALTSHLDLCLDDPFSILYSFAACTCTSVSDIPLTVATLASIAAAIRRFTTVTTLLPPARNLGSRSARSAKDKSKLHLLYKLSTRHDDGNEPVRKFAPDRPVGPPESGARLRVYKQSPAPPTPRSSFLKSLGLSDDTHFHGPGLPILLEPLRRPRRDNRVPQTTSHDRVLAVRRDSSKMASTVQMITSPTADTPGTTLILQTQRQHYIFGTHGEGTQRAMVEQGLRMTKVQNFFMTGKMDWHNAGGLIGMTLTLADSATSAYDTLMEFHRKSKNTKKFVEPPRPKINVYGPPNLKYALNTCRRYIFRKGIPVIATEYKEVPPRKDDQGAILPSWQDEAIQVWALCMSPARKEMDPHREQQLAQLQEGFERSNSFDEHFAPENESAEEREARYDRIRSAVLNMMFNSKWSLDTLVEQHIAKVEPPTAIFVRNSETNRIEQYRGPKPGSGETLPDIKVFTRTPWPGATVNNLPPTTPKTESLSYIVRSQSTRGTFDPKRAKELGLKSGPQFGKLSKGQSVENEKGETITPDMVIGPDRPGNGFAILDVPSADYLETLHQREEFASEDVMKGVQIIYWVLGPGVSGHPSLQLFMDRFSQLEHIVSSVDECVNRLSFDSVAAQTIRLSAIDPARYRLPQHDSKTLPQRSLYGLGSPGRINSLPNVTPADRGMKHSLMPNFRRHVEALTDEEKLRRKEEQETPGVLELEVRAQMDEEVLRLAEEAQQAVKNDHEALSRWRQLLARPDTEVITLGTGSACPSKYRNVSATLVRVPGVGNYLLDAGEGTVGQLQRVFGTDELVDVLRNLRMIWISHLHADHHLGTVSVIREWYRAKHNSVPKYDHPSDSASLAADISSYGLSLVSHEGMIKWLSEYSLVEDFGYSRILPMEVSAVPRFEGTGSRLTYTSLNASGQLNRRILLHPRDYPAVLGLTDLQACKVQHCHGAMAVSLTFPKAAADSPSLHPLKVSYSGDCRPTHTFTCIGRNSTVLVHEATFDDELKGDALAKKHSTTSEALAIGAQMHAKAVVLTHFSQRYQKLPVLQAVHDGEPDDLPRPRAPDDDEDEADVAPDVAAAALPPLDSARLSSRSTSNAPSTATHEKVIKVRARDMKVAIAFDYMRVRIGDIAQMDKFHDALNRLLADEDEAETKTKTKTKTETETETGPVVNRNGKKTSGDEAGGGGRG
ncbi:metallo-beta-lactamase superfamily protein [Paraphaeosphaeria minitans]|uniref:ribonuclease Z n=1 Tax=Paraphaeosphaeria minitans TaxID=565426 RepID=A0A9P6KJ38_9PLEO|nr:metallo-beta-lactamase superfamily protein [Paraphaeosphaeria minitans]